MKMLNITIARGVPQDGSAPTTLIEWFDLRDEQARNKRAWNALFREYDAVIAPTLGVTAFAHDDTPLPKRVLDINGEATPFGLQFAFPGLATFPMLPATSFPIGTDPDGLPIGVQAIADTLQRPQSHRRRAAGQSDHDVMTTAAAKAPISDLSALKFRFNFFKLIVRDLDAMQKFYADTFGFEERSRFTLPTLEEVMLALPGEQFTLVLYRHTDDRDVEIGSGYGPVGFLTRDVDAAVAHAVANGASLVAAPRDMGSMRLAFVKDPEGHEIEMIQFVRPRDDPTT